MLRKCGESVAKVWREWDGVMWDGVTWLMGATEVMGVTEAAGGKKREKKCRGVMVYAGRQVGGRAGESAGRWAGSAQWVCVHASAR